MRFSLLLLTFLITVCSISLAAPGDTLWTRTFGGSWDDRAHSVCATEDGGCVVAGVMMLYRYEPSDLYIVKLDSSGDTMWTRLYGGDMSECAYSVQQTREGGYIAAGGTYSFGNGDFYLIKTNSLGDSVWARSYGGNSEETARSVQQTTDGGYIIAGDTWSYGAGLNDMYLVKTDSLGM